ncbi:MAG: DUF1835 domain-containing protein [Bacteroidetes bacterium]|nr:DUF1835 domain-containing protein [Bacteroidota bacterium]
MTHIVFQEADIATLKQALEMDESLSGNVWLVRDDFAVGPLLHLEVEEGMNIRKDWWRKILKYAPHIHADLETDDRKTVNDLISLVKSDASQEIWIWVAPNVHDRCGYYWLVCQLENILTNIRIVNLGNLPFINEKGSLFYPSNLFDIRPIELWKARKLAVPLSIHSFEAIRDEWSKLSSNESCIRILEDEKTIVAKPIDYFDKNILSGISTTPQTLQKILFHLLGKLKIKTGDAFLAWRISELCQEGKLSAIGNWENGWKEITIQLTEKEGMSESN